MKRLLSRMVVIAAVAGLIVLLWVMYRSESRDRRRLEANQRSLLTDVEYYRTRDSLSAAGVERLTLTNREFRPSCGRAGTHGGGSAVESAPPAIGFPYSRHDGLSGRGAVVRYGDRS